MWVLFLATIKKNQQRISEHYTFYVYTMLIVRSLQIYLQIYPLQNKFFQIKDCTSLQPPDFSSEDVI